MIWPQKPWTFRRFLNLLLAVFLLFLFVSYQTGVSLYTICRIAIGPVLLYWIIRHFYLDD